MQRHKKVNAQGIPGESWLRECEWRGGDRAWQKAGSQGPAKEVNVRQNTQQGTDNGGSQRQLSGRDRTTTHP